eukprot:GHVU01207054.1.p1 GENE.GHVU01207054.1~~GHVU01207054.1.p1  ORF type:complete len:355 (+),score=31.11 GHVU01207054.1:394-1458(+)
MRSPATHGHILVRPVAAGGPGGGSTGDPAPVCDRENVLGIDRCLDEIVPRGGGQNKKNGGHTNHRIDDLNDQPPPPPPPPGAADRRPFQRGPPQQYYDRRGWGGSAGDPSGTDRGRPDGNGGSGFGYRPQVLPPPPPPPNVGVPCQAPRLGEVLVPISSALNHGICDDYEEPNECAVDEECDAVQRQLANAATVVYEGDGVVQSSRQHARQRKDGHGYRRSSRERRGDYNRRGRGSSEGRRSLSPVGERRRVQRGHHRSSRHRRDDRRSVESSSAHSRWEEQAPLDRKYRDDVEDRARSSRSRQRKRYTDSPRRLAAVRGEDDMDICDDEDLNKLPELQSGRGGRLLRRLFHYY